MPVPPAVLAVVGADAVWSRSRALRDGMRAAGAVLVGMAAVAGYSRLPDLRAVIAAALVGLGVVLWRLDRSAVERGAGQAAMLIGAGLLGQLLVVTVAPAPEFVLALVLGPAALALLVLRGTVGWVGLGLIVPTTLASVSGAHSVAVLTGLAVVAVVLARFGTFWIALGATAASGAAGAGVAPVVAVTGIPTEPMDPHVVALVVAVAVPAVLVLVAVLRRDLAGGLVAAGALAVPPVGLLAEGGLTPAIVLGLVLVAAMLAMLIDPVRDLAGRAAGWVRGGRQALDTASEGERDALVAVVGGTMVALAVYAVPALALPAVAQGGVSLVLLLAAARVAWRLPARLGGPLGGAVLAGLALAGPWQRFGLVSMNPALIVLALAVFAAIGLVVSAALITALWLRHRHSGVVAGAALLLLHDLAWLLRTATGDFAAFPTLPVLGPLVLLGAAALVIRAALPVVVAAAGFTFATLLVRTFTDAEARVELLRLVPLTPTDVLLNAQLPDNPAWILPLLLIAAIRPHAGTALVVLFGTQALLVTLS